MTKEITATFGDLMRQAPATANDYLLDAVIYIDEKFGAGYSAQHPELVGAFMNCCATDFSTAVMAKMLEKLSEGCADR